MINPFINKFDKLLEKSNWIEEKEYEIIYQYFIIDKKSNEKYINDKLQEFYIKEENKLIFKFYQLSGFVKYIGEKNNYENKEIKKSLKDILINMIKLGNLERYSYVLSVLYSINNNEVKYYKDQFDELYKSNILYHDINVVFLNIFIKLDEKDYFLIAFQQNIIDNASELYYFSVIQGFDYLINLDNKDFTKLFFELLSYFNLNENKSKLVYNKGYRGLIDGFYKKEFENTIKKLVNRIEKITLTEEKKEAIKYFIINDMNFAFENYESNILKNFFIINLFELIYKKDPNFIIETLNKLKSKNLILSIDIFINKYLKEDQIEDLINIYNETDNFNILFFSYDRFKAEKKNNIVIAFEQSSIGDKIKSRNKKLADVDKKNEEKKKKEIEDKRNEIFSMLNPGNKEYFPKLFQDYHKLINDDVINQKIFDKDEIEKINQSVINQIITYLEIIKIKDYNDNKIRIILRFKKEDNNRHSFSWDLQYLWRIIDIGRHLNI
ncbi:MAG: hypothetical protein V3575_05535, partial [Candidatus Absconditabacteria bacterium]